MNFTAWQIDMLRRGLHAYRVHKSINGRLLPWKIALADIAEMPKTSGQYAGADLDMNLKEEALRRFANGDSVLEPVKLEDVQRFLLHAGVLSEEELAEGSGDAELIAVGRYLANDSSEARRTLKWFAATYESENDHENIADQIEFIIALDPSERFVRVEERYRRNFATHDPYAGSPRARSAPYGTLGRMLQHITVGTGNEDGFVNDRDRAVSPEGMASGNGDHDQGDSGVTVPRVRLRNTSPVGCDSIRRGYGFLSTPLDLLHIFLRGNSSGDRIHYIQVAGVGNPRKPVLMRVGAPITRYVASEHDELTVHDCNICRFLTVEPQPSA